MEPNDLNSPPPSDDAPLDTWLCTRGALPPLPDDGFSQRVLAALPAPGRRAPRPARLVVIGLGTAAGIGFAAYKSLTGAPVELALPTAGPDVAAALAQLADPKLLVALGVTAVTLACVFWGDVRRRVGL